MKFYLLVAVLSCALLSLSKADVAVTEQGLARVEEVPQHVYNKFANEDQHVVESTGIEQVLKKIPILVQAVADEQMDNEHISDDEHMDEEHMEDDADNTTVAPPIESSVNNREGKQLIGFIPSYVLRQAIRLAEEEQNVNAQDELEEERAMLKRKRMRKRNSKNSSKAKRRHNNNNKRKLSKRRKVNSNKNAVKATRRQIAQMKKSQRIRNQRIRNQRIKNQKRRNLKRKNLRRKNLKKKNQQIKNLKRRNQKKRQNKKKAPKA